MMLGPAIISGGVVALVVGCTRLLRAFLPPFGPVLGWGGALFVLLGSLILYRRIRRYDGFADLLIHVHAPNRISNPFAWAVRGAQTFLLSLFTGQPGKEGAALEWAKAVLISRTPGYSKWSEQQRRTDVGCSLSATVAGVFGAPFAGFMVPLEMGIGGRGISIALASIIAFLGVRLITGGLGAENFDIAGALFGFRFTTWQDWLMTLLVAFTSAGAAIFMGFLVRNCKNAFLFLSKKSHFLRIIGAGLLLAVTCALYSKGNRTPVELLEQVLWSRKANDEIFMLVLSGFLKLLFILTAFGTAGIFWPVYALGGFWGFLVYMILLKSLHGFAAAAGLVGASAFFGAFLGIPISGALISFELTQNVHVLLPCLFSALVAKALADRFQGKNWITNDLENRGIQLWSGRKKSILDSIKVRDAMVVDHEAVNEKDTISSLYSRILTARYPFLPVVNSLNVYLGLLTVDAIDEACHSEDPRASHSPLVKLLEAKDLLYRSGVVIPTIREDQNLTEIVKLMDEHPCLPVLDQEKQIRGLLFVHNVRLVYERELARSALSRNLGIEGDLG